MVQDSTLAQQLQHLSKAVGAIAGPFDCYLALRGMKTLAVRLERQSSNALGLAKWLTDPQTACATKVSEVRRMHATGFHHRIFQVHYPGLSSHPQHQLCKEQMRTGGAVVLLLQDGRVWTQFTWCNQVTVRLSAEDGASEQQQLDIVQRCLLQLSSVCEPLW